MKKILSFVLVVASIVASLAVFTSCGEPEDLGAEIAVYLGESVYDFDPSDYYIDDNSAQIMSLIYEPLFTLDEKGKLTLDGAAKEYEVDEEEREITITLRETYWSDGERVTAEHFIYAWRQLIVDPNKSNAAAALFLDVENAVDVMNGRVSIYEFGAVADAGKVVITYREGADYNRILTNLACVATSPVREDIVISAPGYWTKSTANIVTNGPFKIQVLDYDAGEFSLGRNTGYHLKPTAKDETKVVTPARLVSFFGENGNITTLSYSDIANKTMFYMGEMSLEDRKANAGAAVVADSLSTYTYVFNTNKPIFADKNVRKALSLAIDRTKIIEAVTFGKAATGFLTNAASADIYSDKISQQLISADAKMDEAMALLEGVSIKDKSFTLTVNDDEESVAIAELVAESWGELGFNVKINAVSTVAAKVADKTTGETIEILDSAVQTLVKKAAKGNYEFDVLAVDWQMYSADGFVALAAFSGELATNGVDFTDNTVNTNISGWSSVAYDVLVRGAYEAEDERERYICLRAAEALLMEECPIVPIMFNQNAVFVSKDLKKMKANGNGYFVFTEVKQKNYKDYLETDGE